MQTKTHWQHTRPARSALSLEYTFMHTNTDIHLQRNRLACSALSSEYRFMHTNTDTHISTDTHIHQQRTRPACSALSRAMHGQRPAPVPLGGTHRWPQPPGVLHHPTLSWGCETPACACTMCVIVSTRVCMHILTAFERHIHVVCAMSAHCAINIKTETHTAHIQEDTHQNVDKSEDRPTHIQTHRAQHSERPLCLRLQQKLAGFLAMLCSTGGGQKGAPTQAQHSGQAFQGGGGAKGEHSTRRCQTCMMQTGCV